MDVRDILRHTSRLWGRDQRAVYRATLDEAMQALLIHPFRGLPRLDLAPSVHALPIAAHIVYYSVGDGEITILRVLHTAMDAAAAFRHEPLP